MDEIEKLLCQPVSVDYRDALRKCFEDWNNRKVVSEPTHHERVINFTFFLKINVPTSACRRVLEEVLEQERSLSSQQTPVNL